MSVKNIVDNETSPSNSNSPPIKASHDIVGRDDEKSDVKHSTVTPDFPDGGLRAWVVVFGVSLANLYELSLWFHADNVQHLRDVSSPFLACVTESSVH